MVVTFCGHSKIEDFREVEKWLNREIEKLLKKGVKTFYLGGYGEFDILCKNILLNYKKLYNDIDICLVVPYLNHNMCLEGYDSNIYPEIEKTPPKFAILKRNEWMVLKSDIVVAYVTYTFGGAYKTLNFAKRKKKSIVSFQ